MLLPSTNADRHAKLSLTLKLNVINDTLYSENHRLKHQLFLSFQMSSCPQRFIENTDIAIQKQRNRCEHEPLSSRLIARDNEMKIRSPSEPFRTKAPRGSHTSLRPGRAPKKTTCPQLALALLVRVCDIIDDNSF